MELNFDKEMDALLRQAARSGEVVSTNSQSHLDADEISAFAENALPEKTREFYIEHFADCDRCRTILSNTILLNSEAEIETASSAVSAVETETIETKTPWYRKLFLMPNLAYTMGALVLIFGGMFGFLVLQNLNQTGISDVSQIQREESLSSGPNTSGENYPSNSNSSIASNTAANAANTMTESNAATVNPAANVQSSPGLTSPNEPSPTADALSEQRDQNLAKANKENDFSIDGADDKKPERKEDKPIEPSKDAEITRSDEAKKVITAAPPPAPKTVPAQPSTTQGRAESRSQNMREKKREDAGLSASGENRTRQIGGKTFNKVNGVWIDSAYNNNNSQLGNMALPRTKAIRRGSSEYRKLDKQVRIIAESLDAPVIILWKDGAYRIQ